MKSSTSAEFQKESSPVQTLNEHPKTPSDQIFVTLNKKAFGQSWVSLATRSSKKGLLAL